MAEVRPFLDRILAGRNVPPARYEEVVAHYEMIGGRSPFKDHTIRQAQALERELHGRGIDLEVSAAYRFSEPFIAQTVAQFEQRGEPVIAVVLSALQSPASWDAYTALVPGATLAAPLAPREGFIDAHAQRVRSALHSLDETDFSRAALVFTAHSIPAAMAARSPYVRQFESAAAVVADRMGASSFYLAYTSRSGSPAEAWLEPDVRDLLQELGASGVDSVVIDPLGFLCDHVEVLYDLDIEAAAVAQRNGIRMARASALNDHPSFIGAMADAVQECLP
jgi:ferrochelatase